MRKLRCKLVGIVVRENPDNTEETYEPESTTDKGYKDYLSKHGKHFTEALAEHASKMMVNSNGQSHSWTSSQVKDAMKNLGLNIPSKSTIGDLTYAANMAYADFFPDPLKDETSCLRYAYRLANDPDGYEGMIFCRWIADIKNKGKEIDWELYI